MQTSEIASQLSIRWDTTSKDYIKPLLEQGKIKKVDGTKKYQAVESNFTKNSITSKIYTRSEIMATKLMQNWNANNSAKHKHPYFVRFAQICLGKVSPNFRIHPDSITKDNWEEVITNAKQAILETTGKRELSRITKFALRHAIIYGLDQNISQEKGRKLGIDGDKTKPISSTLHLSKENYDKGKKILLKNYSKFYFVKFGFNVWCGGRPSTNYTIKTEDLVFFDRTVEFIQIADGKKRTNPKVVESWKDYLSMNPDAKGVTIGKYTQRACSLEKFHEFKTDKDFPKFIIDEDFVIELEKYWKQRKFEKKKYLFWNDNSTEFTFENYDTIVKSSVVNELKIWKSFFVEELEFKKEDFGKQFRANYAFRHFSIQMWLVYTDWNYELVSEMFHEDIATLKQWYGGRNADTIKQEIAQVIV